MGKPKRKLTKAEKAEKKPRREKYMTIFVKARSVLISGASQTGVTEWGHALHAALGPEQCTLLDVTRYSGGENATLSSDMRIRLGRDLRHLRTGKMAACPALPCVQDQGATLFDALHPAPLLLLIAPQSQALPAELRDEIDERWWLGTDPPADFDRHTDLESGPVELIETGLSWMTEFGLDVECHRSACLLDPDFFGVAGRMGLNKLGQRLERQAKHWAGWEHQGEGVFFFERWIPVDRLVEIVINASGLGRVGRRGARRLVVERNVVQHPNLPAALDGFTILQLSDLHLDLETGVIDELAKVAPDLKYDVAVITGDYRNSTRDNYAHSIKRTRDILKMLRPPRVGILGNHDFIEMAPALEASGLRMLLNEGVFVERGDARVLIAGIDDPHFYETHDLARAGRVPAEDNVFRILLSHSPEMWREAAPDYDLMLSGHTHGGQICLPGGVPLVRNGRCPARLLSGAWRVDKMQGYTSRGTGCCGVPMRFFCPPEITLHELRPAR